MAAMGVSVLEVHLTVETFIPVLESGAVCKEHSHEESLKRLLIPLKVVCLLLPKGIHFTLQYCMFLVGSKVKVKVGSKVRRQIVPRVTRIKD